MLIRKKHKRLDIALWVSAFVILLIVSSYFIDLTGEICGKNEYTNAKECARYHVAPYAFLRIIQITNDYGAAITALATVAVAGFTLTLWLVTGKAVALARDEFNATHRPELRIKFVRKTGRPDEYIGVDFTVVNAGTSPATVIGSAAHIIFCFPWNLPSPQEITANDIVEKRTFIPSEPRTYSATTNDINLIIPEFEDGMQQMHLIGFIVYQNSLNEIRTTYFCRAYDSRTGRFTATNDPDYESTD